MKRNVSLSSTAPLTRKTPLSRGTSQLQRSASIGRAVPLAGRNTTSRTGDFPAAESAVSGPAKTAPRTSSSGKVTPPAPSEFTAKVKRLVRRRAGRGDEFDALCEACGAWLGADAGEFQHRDARGMGGSKDPVTNSAANAVLLCGCAALGTGCHGLCEDRDEHMNGMGFWLRSGQYPLTEPVMLHGKGGGGLTLWLAADGLGPDGTGYLLSSPLAVAS